MNVRELIHEANRGPKYEYKAVFVAEYMETGASDTAGAEEKESYVLFARQRGYERWEPVGSLGHALYDHAVVTTFDPYPEARFEWVPLGLLWMVKR